MSSAPRMLSFEFFNTIVIFSAATLCIWMAFAIGRLIRVLRVRASFLSQKIVMIRGLGGVLRSLTDLATYSHVNSLVNTRQSAAPSRLRHLVVPYVMSETPDALSTTSHIVNNGGATSTEVVLNLSFDVSSQSEVYLLIDFNLEKFKELTQRLEDNSGKRRIVKKLVTDFTDKANHKDNLQAFVQSRSCSGISYVNNIQAGHHDVAISLGALPASIKSFAIVFVPVEKKVSVLSSFSRSSSASSPSRDARDSYGGGDREVQSALIAQKLDEVAKDNTLRYSEPIFGDTADRSSFMSEVSSQMDGEELLKWSLGIAVVSGKDSISLPNGDSRTALSTVETMVVGSNYTLYSVKEVFGWKAASAAKAKEDARMAELSTNITPPSSTSDGEDLSSGYDTDCVICLSEKKDVVLLPCRHLCVCRNCLLHIDKCPVCRSVHKDFIIQTNISS